MGRKAGKKSVLYSVWENKTDRLLILDGTVDEVSELLGINPNTIRRMAVHTEKNPNENLKYMIQAMKVKDIKREERS